MGITAFSNSEEDRFKTVAEYKDCIARGGEVVFLWEQVEYGVGLADPPDTCKNPGEKAPPQYCVTYADGSHEKWYKTPEDTLDYRVGEDRLGDIITKAIVTYRTL